MRSGHAAGIRGSDRARAGYTCRPMSKASSWAARLRDTWAPTPTVAVALAAAALLGWTLHEVVPRYRIERPPREGTGLLDRPTFLIGDCIYYRATLISLLEDHDLDVRNNLEPQGYPMASNVSLGRSGTFYPKHPILLAVLALPFYALAGDTGLLAFNLLQLGALVLVMWVGARRYAPDVAAFGLLLWFAFGTMLRPAAYNFAPDVLSSLLVVGGIVALLYARSGLAGALLGLSVWAKWTNGIFLPVGLAALALQRDWKTVSRLAGAAVLPICALLGLNVYMFGSPFLTPYDRVLVVENAQWVLEPTHRSFFTVPFWGGLWTQMVDPRLGLLEADPPLLLALPGWILLYRRARLDALLTGGACLAQIATFAKYEQWDQSSYGPRFLLSVVAISALPAAAALGKLFATEARTGSRPDRDET